GAPDGRRRDVTKFLAQQRFRVTQLLIVEDAEDFAVKQGRDMRIDQLDAHLVGHRLPDGEFDEIVVLDADIEITRPGLAVSDLRAELNELHEPLLASLEFFGLTLLAP